MLLFKIGKSLMLDERSKMRKQADEQKRLLEQQFERNKRKTNSSVTLFYPRLFSLGTTCLKVEITLTQLLSLKKTSGLSLH